MVMIYIFVVVVIFFILIVRLVSEWLICLGFGFVCGFVFFWVGWFVCMFFLGLK